MIAINCDGLVHMAKRVVRTMLAQGPEQGERRILVTSSTSATTPTPYEPVYGPTKAFGFSFAESIREELRSEGITVTALLPGATDSDFHANAGMGAPSSATTAGGTTGPRSPARASTRCSPVTTTWWAATTPRSSRSSRTGRCPSRTRRRARALARPDR